jgi:glutamate-1-semialdehyde 2,1-aminomutase
MVTSIEQRYIDLHPKSAQLYATSKDIFPNGVTHDTRNLKPFPYFAEKAMGSHKWDVDGNDIVDYRTGHGGLILGHTHPDIVEAVTEQMQKGTHFSASTQLEIEWGQRVRELMPCADKIRFHSSGTEATMMAFRMVRAFTGKTKIIKFENHFHGWHDYAMVGGGALGGIPEETMSTMIVLPPNNISVVDKTLEENDDIAAIILEPTGSHMGNRPIEPKFLTELREVTKKHGVILVFDEVVTGFRASKGGAQEYYGVTPDICTMAKILGGGLPGGAVAGRADIIDMIQLREDPEFNSMQRVGHNGTFNANPLCAAAGIKALELLATTPVNETTDARGGLLKDGLNDLLSRMEIPGCASGLNSMVFLRIGVDHECDKEVCIMTGADLIKREDPVREHQFSLALYNHGVDAGTRFIMSAAHTEQDIGDTVEAIGRALSDIRSEGLI